MKPLKRVLRFHVSMYPQKKGGYWIYIGNVLKKVSKKLRDQLTRLGKIPARVGIHVDKEFKASLIVMFSERPVDDDHPIADPTGAFSGRNHLITWYADSSVRCPSDKTGRIYVTNKILINNRFITDKEILKPTKKVATLYSNGQDCLLLVPVTRG